jgi:group I intron endonuclease
MQGIYKITSPSGKIYIGQSTNIEKRVSRYKSLSCKKQTKLYNSLRKYGWCSHIFEIIEIVEDDKMLILRETAWKIHYDVLNIPSLCCRMDGLGGKMSAESNLRLSISIKKYWDSLNPEEREMRLVKTIAHNKDPKVIEKIKIKIIGVKKSISHKENLRISQNKEETVNKRKKGLANFWLNISDEERERKRLINIESQNRPETLKKLSENNGSRRIEVRIKQSEAAKKRKKLECPHCGKFMDPGNSKRHHFDNCKNKKG